MCRVAVIYRIVSFRFKRARLNRVQRALIHALLCGEV